MKSQNELISIGMPVYNGEQFLREAIVSILSQTYTNFELIIADDCSTDNSAGIYEEFAKKDKRIRIFKHKKNIGSLPNFNFVIQKAKGKYFLWAAQDDLREKKALSILKQLFDEYPEAMLSVSNYQNKFKNKTYFVYPPSPYDNRSTNLTSLLHFLKTNNLSYFYGLHKTNNLLKTGGYHLDWRPFFHGSDFLTIFKVLLNGKFVYTDEVLFYKRDTGLFTKQFNVIESNKLSSDVWKKIIRYLCFPLFYVLDFLYATFYVALSKMTFFEKLIVESLLIQNIAVKMIGFIRNIVVGIFIFLKGFIKKLL